MLRNIEEEGQLWQARDRGRQKNRPEEEEAEVDDGEKATEQEAASDMDSGNSESTSKFAKRPPGFY